MAVLLPSQVRATLAPETARTIFGSTFFPHIIGPAFSNGLALSFHVGLLLCVLAGVASALRGGRPVEDEAREAAVSQSEALRSSSAEGVVLASPGGGGEL
jgi:hypothetical protein